MIDIHQLQSHPYVRSAPGIFVSRCSRFFLAQSAPTHGVIFQQRGENWSNVCPFKAAKQHLRSLHMGSTQAMCRLFIGMHTSQPWTSVQVWLHQGLLNTTTWDRGRKPFKKKCRIFQEPFSQNEILPDQFAHFDLAGKKVKQLQASHSTDN